MNTQSQLSRHKVHYEATEDALDIWKAAGQRLRIRQWSQIITSFPTVFARILGKR